MIVMELSGSLTHQGAPQIANSFVSPVQREPPQDLDSTPGISWSHVDGLETGATNETYVLSSGYDPMYVEPLTSRERDVLEVLAQGASNQEIAQALVIAPNTVKRHVRTILAKLGVHNRTKAVARAQELDLLANMRSHDRRAFSRW